MQKHLRALDEIYMFVVSCVCQCVRARACARILVCKTFSFAYKPFETMDNYKSIREITSRLLLERSTLVTKLRLIIGFGIESRDMPLMSNFFPCFSSTSVCFPNLVLFPSILISLHKQEKIIINHK